MNPIWIDYNEWEDYQNGMYGKRMNLQIANKCLKMFRSKRLYSHMKKCVTHYPKSAKVNLSKTVFNQQAWIGQSACNIYTNATIEETTYAWVRLTQKERNEANRIADIVIKEFINENLQ